MDVENITTLSQHLKRAGADNELRRLIVSFAHISLDAQHRFPKYLRGAIGNRNKYGEAVEALDDWVNGYLCDSLVKTGLVRKIYSEELKKPLVSNANAPFVLTLDPVDGSSNIVTNNPFGSIVGVYGDDLPQGGKKLLAAFCKLYGPVNTFIYSVGKGTHEFVKHYDGEGRAQFFLLAENMKLPKKGQVFGAGGNPHEWSPSFSKFVDGLYWKEKLKTRYSGTFVADFSQVLHKGGLFAYPANKKLPQGKLRLFYEAMPVAFMIEQAGGASWSGKESLLEVKGRGVDARTPVYIGNREIIARLKKQVR